VATAVGRHRVLQICSEARYRLPRLAASTGGKLPRMVQSGDYRGHRASFVSPGWACASGLEHATLVCPSGVAITTQLNVFACPTSPARAESLHRATLRPGMPGRPEFERWSRSCPPSPRDPRKTASRSDGHPPPLASPGGSSTTSPPAQRTRQPSADCQKDASRAGSPYRRTRTGITQWAMRVILRPAPERCYLSFPFSRRTMRPPRRRRHDVALCLTRLLSLERSPCCSRHLAMAAPMAAHCLPGQRGGLVLVLAPRGGYGSWHHLIV